MAFEGAVCGNIAIRELECAPGDIAVLAKWLSDPEGENVDCQLMAATPDSLARAAREVPL
ncbi:MAG TPA: hypothetical protein VGK74_05550 [Symbiobacteriaceae bacterium]